LNVHIALSELHVRHGACALLALDAEGLELSFKLLDRARLLRHLRLQLPSKVRNPESKIKQLKQIVKGKATKNKCKK
jgi:hypothetical protein